MQTMYGECTICEKMLSEHDKELNKTHGNLYYTICEACVDKYTERLMAIMEDE